MSIHEQITALLDGELADAGAVAELMHVLAVSPEKRDLLVEQLSLKRQFTSAAATVVPPSTADLAIMRGLGAVDAGFGSASTAVDNSDDAPVAPAPIPASPAGSMFGYRSFVLGAAALILALGGFGAGYFLRGDDSTLRVAEQSPMNNDRILAVARDAIAMLEKTATRSIAPRPTAAYRSIGGSGGGRNSAGQSSLNREGGGRNERSVTPASHDDTQPVAHFGTIDVTQLRPPLHPLPRSTRIYMAAEVRPANDEITMDVTPNDVIDDATPLGVQLGVRNNFRLSLPRVYGLAQSPTALLDRELIGTYEIGRGDDAISRMRVGAAFGQTQFSMVFHSNSGGEPIDTIFEQSPQALYGRVFAAPEVFRLDDLAGLLEVGGGYSGAGGFGTVGVNVEFRPTRQVAVHAGASSWLLWTRYNDAVNLSTNLNAHLGVMIGF